MDDPPTNSKRSAGGLLLAISIVGGAIIGVALHQPSAGLVIGALVGASVALGLWLIDRRKG